MSILGIAAVGDVSFSGVYRQRESSTQLPWRALAAAFDGVEIRMANLESAITEAPKVAESKFALRGASHVIETLKASKIDLLNLANNHMMDFGLAGIADTIKLLDREGIAHVGAGRNLGQASTPLTATYSNQSVGFISFCEVEQISPLYAAANREGVSPLGEDSTELVKQLASEVDWVIVQIHWGTEMCRLPSPRQRRVARRIVDAGADALICHHPHVLQPMEIIGNTPVWYSLGNFTFSNEFWRGQGQKGPFVAEYRVHPLARQTGVARMFLNKNGSPDCQIVFGQIRPDGEVVVDDRLQRKTAWKELCEILQSESYEKQWQEEEVRAVQLRAWQSRGNSFYRRLRIKAFQYGLIKQA